MKKPTCLTLRDVAKIKILLIVLLMLGVFGLYLHNFADSVGTLRPKLSKASVLQDSVRKVSVKTRCYDIPYTREQLKNIEKHGGKALEELTQKLNEITRGQDLTYLVGLPRIEFDEKSSKLCMDFNAPVTLPRPLPETHLV